MGSLGPLEVLVLFIVTIGIPMLVMWRVAASRDASGLWALWGVLGYLGMVIGLILLLTRKKPARQTGGF